MIRQEFGWAFAMAIGTSFDTLDGAVAKLSNRVTKLGALLDSTLDRLSDALMVIGFYYGGLLGLELALIVLVESYLISYIRSRAELAAKGDFVLNVGIIERPERIIILMLALILKLLNLPQISITGVFIILALLSFITILQRMVIAGKRLSK